jgi:hypothetical protein
MVSSVINLSSNLRSDKHIIFAISAKPHEEQCGIGVLDTYPENGSEPGQLDLLRLEYIEVLVTVHQEQHEWHHT